ncbi:formamidopyrimidine-DNA glycosylase, putative [Babesia ovata]|uniref:Formamidopyrimidine-DNA glycosylase, putative n=1 Tax=Babesia ovata TaxID=189622 RepID=A0A2H6KHR3_9APIC|nr:formamidopyrimidine-DNA glycosylase, putative [Babesia ovata]GBE62532.1 formamidopyrimidine-DNA glycosylase, putative [Babesia ovata]
MSSQYKGANHDLQRHLLIGKCRNWAFIRKLLVPQQFKIVSGAGEIEHLLLYLGALGPCDVVLQLSRDMVSWVVHYVKPDLNVPLLYVGDSLLEMFAKLALYEHRGQPTPAENAGCQALAQLQVAAYTYQTHLIPT